MSCSTCAASSRVGVTMSARTGWRAGEWLPFALGGQPLQNGQGEAGGLAGAGLRGAEKVFAGQDDGDRLRLDGGGLGIALLGDSAEQLGAKAE